MTSLSRLAEIAALAGDPARAVMLHALMDGRALTARELSRAAGVAPQTASGHLARLVEAGLIRVEKQGRHRYHQLAAPMVARMLESIMQVASAGDVGGRRLVVGPRDVALRTARTCYDHLAGRLGVALTDGLVARGYIELTTDAGLVTPEGSKMLARLGIDMPEPAARRTSRPLCRPCLDWSERRPHLAGQLGAALCNRALAAGWVRRMTGTRAVAVTPHGRRVLHEALGVTLD